MTDDQLTGDGDEWDSLWKDSEALLRIQVHSNLGVEAKGFKVRTHCPLLPDSQDYLARYGDVKMLEAHDNTGHVSATRIRVH